MSALLPPEQITKLSEMIYSGQKIEAIKVYRELTQVGLKEAKDEVEALEAALRKQFPEKFTATNKAGCLGFLLIAGGFGGLGGLGGLGSWLLG